jgi:cytochrome c oxidase subunit 4
MGAHGTGRIVYFVVFGALMVLTATTVGVSFIELGPLHVVAALAIAVIKAVLVLLYFMHLLHSSRLTWVVFAAAVYWLAIMLALTLSDYNTRAWM